MSTKTIRSRIALATVVALGAGVLSLVSTSAANANDNTTAGNSVSAASADGIANIGTALNNRGAAVTDTSAAGTANASFGLLAIGDLAGGKAAGLIQTATLTSGGSLVVYMGRTSANTSAVYTVTGGTLSGAATSSVATINYNPTLTAAAISSATASTTAAIVVKPNSGVSSFVVNAYTIASASTSTIANSPTSGTTLVGSITVSVSSASASGALSLTNSKVIYTGKLGGTTETTTVLGLTDGTNPTTATAQYPAVGTSSWNSPQYASIILKDAYSVVVPAGHIVQATATNGAYVAFSATANGAVAAPASAGTSSSAFTTTTASQASIGFTVSPSIANAASNTTVTVSYDGVVVGTKSFSFNGPVAKVVLGTPSNGLAGNSGTAAAGAQNAIAITFKDSAGTNLIVGSSGNTTAYPASLANNSAGTVGTGITLNGSYSYPTTLVTQGYVAFGCASNSSSGSVQVQYVNVDGTVVLSNQVPVSCSGAPSTYKATFDKSSYAPGDIATLNVTFKDANGAIAADNATSYIASAATGKTPSIQGSNLTPTNGATSNAGTSSDNTTNGVATYKFIVGSTGGSYQAVVDFPLVDSAGVQAAITVPYTIKTSDTSLNDVLKGIVSLIASINKQIAALAKLVTKK